MKESNQGDVMGYIIVVGLILAVAFSLIGCSSNEKMKEQLEKEHPDCFVLESLTVECPGSSGFGISIINEQQNKKTKRKE